MIVVPPEGLQRGFGGLMKAYNGQRVGAAAVALGIAQGAYELALDYSRTREQFGRPICEFQGLQWMLADMATALDAARLMVWRAAAGAGKSGFPDAKEAAQAKILASETAVKVSRTTRSRCSAPPATRGTCRWSAWSATPACSRSAAARRRSCARWWLPACSDAGCRRPDDGR